MTLIVNGETYYYVDTIYDEDLIYDIYQNDRDQVVYEIVGTMY